MNELSALRPVQKTSVSISRLCTVAILYSIALFAIFYETFWSIVSIWLHSETFAHGLLIVPIVLYLIWNKRLEVATISDTSVDWKVLLLVFPLGLAWLLGQLVHVLVVQQLAVVAILIVGFWYILGDKITAVLIFPFGFLFLGVPMGENLIAPMMDLTAVSTVKMVQLSGIPVYRDGMYFSLPSGNWSVVEACSGVRYLIASFTLGVLYAYMTYTSSLRRIAFVVASIIVPIVANLLRAYFIVMLGHWSDMTIATGVDHLIYGWIFFGFVMFLLFWIGSLWREKEGTTASEDNSPLRLDNQPTSVLKPQFRAFAVIAFAAVWPVIASGIAVTNEPTNERVTSVVPPAGNWSSNDSSDEHWVPMSITSNSQFSTFYKMGDVVVGLSIDYFYPQSDSMEVIGNTYALIGSTKAWRLKTLRKVQVGWGTDTLNVDQLSLVGETEKLVTWVWYRIGDTYTSNPYSAKVFQVLEKIFGSGRGTMRIVLTTSAKEDEAGSEMILQEFVNAHSQNIVQSLNEVMEPSKK